jgi:hypothetical protein
VEEDSQADTKEGHGRSFSNLRRTHKYRNLHIRNDSYMFMRNMKE